MGGVEQQRAGDRILLGPRRQHALRDVAAAARLGARVPHGPPLHRERDDEHCEQRRPVRRVGQQAQRLRIDFTEQPVEPADLRLLAEIFAYIALASLWNLLAGYAGLVSVGQQAYVGLGAYLLFGTAFFAAMIVTQTERGDRMFLRMLGSAADHMWDHGVVGGD